jgi:hypothetical protein
MGGRFLRQVFAITSSTTVTALIKGSIKNKTGIEFIKTGQRRPALVKLGAT